MDAHLKILAARLSAKLAHVGHTFMDILSTRAAVCRLQDRQEVLLLSRELSP